MLASHQPPFVGLFFWLLAACTPPNVDKNPILQKKVDTTSHPQAVWLIGNWEVLSVDGKPIEKLPEDEIPFRQLRIEADGSLRLDTFQTEYTLKQEEGGLWVLSYDSIGVENRFWVRFIDEDNAEIVETRQDGAQNSQTCKLTVRRF